MDSMKEKGATTVEVITQKQPRKTDEKTQRAVPMSKSVSEAGKGSFTIKR